MKCKKSMKKGEVNFVVHAAAPRSGGTFRWHIHCFLQVFFEGLKESGYKPGRKVDYLKGLKIGINLME